MMTMNQHDDIFRYILIAGFLLIMPVGVYHRFKSRTNERLDRMQEGIVILVGLRLVGLAGMGGLIAYMVDPSSMAWSSLALPGWMRWAGVCIGACGGLMLTWTFRHLGKNLTDTVVTRQEHSLVRSGPYRWIRHPFYTSATLAILANSLVAANWFLFVAGVLFVILITIRTRKEEENLLARFGSEYQTYMDKTGRFLPKNSIANTNPSKETIA